MPKFTDISSWQSAELLMQPAFIRILDHIRKELDQSAWKGTFENILIWTEETTEETKALVIDLRQQLEVASTEAADGISAALAKLPTPYPGYLLCLQSQNQHFNFDLWELCYQVCFRNYNSLLSKSNNWQVEIDSSLIEDDTGDVDWQKLDAKAGQIVTQLFASLPDA
jgi:hypothetical protein